MAPRFLAGAFCLRSRVADPVLPGSAQARPASTPAQKAIGKLAVIVAYAMLTNVFFILLETFTIFYARIPGRRGALRISLRGTDGNHHLVPWMWLSALLAIVALAVLLVPAWRTSRRLLPVGVRLRVLLPLAG